MNLDIASDNPFDNEEAFLDFLGQNQISHQQINEFMRRQGHSPIDFSLYGNPKLSKTWLMDHQLLHQNEFDLLQLGSDNLPDLSVVDFEDKDQYRDWMENHAAVHDLVNSTLGITT